MPNRVTIPDIGVVEFPDGMDEQTMSSIIKREFFPEPSEMMQPVYAGQEIPKTVAPVTPPSTVPPSIDLNVETAQRARETPIDFREMAQKTKEHLLTGPEAIKPFTVDKDDHWVKAVAKEAANLPIGLANFFLTPLGTITPFVAPAAPGLVAGGFALDTLAGVANQVGDLLGSWDKLSSAEQAAALTRITGSTALAGLLAKAGKKYLGEALNNARKTIISETGRDIFLGSPAQRAASMLESAAERMPSELLGARAPTPIVQPVTPTPMARPPDMVTMPESAIGEPGIRNAKISHLLQEGVSQKDAIDLVDGKTTVQEVVGKNLREINPPGDFRSRMVGHAEAWQEAFDQAVERLGEILQKPEAAKPAAPAAPAEVRSPERPPQNPAKMLKPGENMNQFLHRATDSELIRMQNEGMEYAKWLREEQDYRKKTNDPTWKDLNPVIYDAEHFPSAANWELTRRASEKAAAQPKEEYAVPERSPEALPVVPTPGGGARVVEEIRPREELAIPQAEEKAGAGPPPSAIPLAKEVTQSAEIKTQGKEEVPVGLTGKLLISELTEEQVSKLAESAGVKKDKATRQKLQELENKGLLDSSSIKPVTTTPAETKTAGEVKEPWEMTKAEYLSKTSGEKPVAAAVKLSDGTILQGRAHPLIQIKEGQKVVDAEGFVTNKGRYVSRDEAAMLTGGDYWQSILKGEQSGAAETVLEPVEEAFPVQSEAWHKQSVAKALREGKPVPKEVLADYQDLKAATPEPTGIEKPVTPAPPKAEPERRVTVNVRGPKNLEIPGAKRAGEMRFGGVKFWSIPESSLPQARKLGATLNRELTKTMIQPEPPAPSMGPGAQTVGEPGKAQIEQLTDAMRGVQGRKLTLGEKVKDAFAVGEAAAKTKDAVSRALSGLKSAGDYLYRKWAGFDTVDEMLRAKGDLSADLEKRGWRVREFVKQVQKAMPDKRQRAAIAKWVDAGGDAADLQRGLAETKPQYRQAYQDALNLSGDALVTAQNIQNYFDARLQEAIDAGVLEHGIEDYIHRIYEKDPKARDAALAHVQSGILAKNPALAKKRIFQFDWEAEKLGYRPVQDFLPRIAQYESSLSKAIAAREFIKKATTMKAPDGRPVIGVKGMGFPVENAEGVREATLIRPSINPKAEIGTAEYRGDYVNREYPALSKWKWVASDTAGNPILLQGDVAIHPAFVSRVDALLEPSKVRYGKYGKVLRPAMQVGSTVKQTMLDMSFFHQVQIAVHAAEHRVMPWKLIRELDFENPNIDGLLRGGITLGGEYYTGHYGEGLVGRSLTRAVPGLGQLMESYHNWLFQNFIPRVKMTMGLDALERNRRKYAKELSGGKMTERDLFHLTAQQANAAFGELNYTMLERNKTTQDLARLILLAPDFLEARGRFAGQAFTKYGSEQRMALFLGAVTMYTLARIANKVLDDQYHFEPENLFSVVYNGRSYGLRTVQGDILHFLKQPLQFWMSRLNPVYGRTMLELATGRDYFGRKRTFTEQMGDAISTMVPIALRTGRERKLWESVINAFGVTARRWNDVDSVYKLAQDWKAKNGIQERGEFIYDSEKDPLRPLKIALSFNDEAEAVLELKKLLDSGKSNLRQLTQYFDRYATMPFTGSRANDAKFRLTLNEDERKTYEAAVEHRRSITRLFRKARSQLNTAPPAPTPPPTPPANPFSALPNAAE